MPQISAERARWLAGNILPLEPQLRAWLKRIVPAGLEVDDIIQEAYAKLAALPGDAQINYPKAYLYQITKRLISEHVRRSAVIPIDTIAEPEKLSLAETDFTPERILSARQELERVYQAIARLPGPCRAVFVMRKFDDMPQKAIAAKLRISENAVEKRMTRALRVLLEHLRVETPSVSPVRSLVLGTRGGQRGA